MVKMWIWGVALLLGLLVLLCYETHELSWMTLKTLQKIWKNIV